MKVLHITDYYPSKHKVFGGAEIATLNLIRELNKNKIKNYILTTKSFTKSDNTFAESKNIYDFIKNKEKFTFLDKIISNIDYIKNFIPFDPIVFIKSFFIIKKIKPDIIHFHNAKKLSFSPLLVSYFFFKIPSVITIYDYWYFCLNQTLIDSQNKFCKSYNSKKCVKCANIPSRFKILVPVRNLIFKKITKLLKGFIFLSKTSAEIGINYKIPKNKIKVSYLIYNENHKSKIMDAPTDKYILYVGWIQKRKGVHILIKAFNYLLKEFPELKLYIIGENINVEPNYKNEIYKMISEYNMNKNIKILGKLSHQETKYYIENAKLIVIPEQWENMSPVVLMEAMFNSKPIVASNIGGIPEILRDNIDGLLADYNSPKDFYDKIKILLENENLSMQLSQNAYYRAKEIFDTRKNTDIIIELYKEITNE